MPELPEVEALRRLIELRLAGNRLKSAEFLHPVILQEPSPLNFLEQIAGLALSGVRRRGKYLQLELKRDLSAEHANYQLFVHLRMQGDLKIERSDEAPSKWYCAGLIFQNGLLLRYYDMWRWGRWALLPAGDVPVGFPGFVRLGPEPMDAAFTPAYLAERLDRVQAPIKMALLNQRLTAGLGSIYCDESLHRAGIHPSRPGSSLSSEEIENLWTAARAVLDFAVRQGRAYAEQRALTGDNLDSFDGVYTPVIYDRPGKPCPNCGCLLEKIQLRGRGTTFCPYCQPVAD